MNKKKWILNISLMILVLGLTYYAVLREADPRILFKLLDGANGWYWVLGFVLTMVFVVCESHILRLLLNSVNAYAPKGHCLYYSFVSFFFSAITPSAGGGQPAQLLYMRKDGIRSGVSAPLLAIITICYKSVLIIYGIIALIVRPKELMDAPSGAIWWCVLGFVFTSAFITACVLLIVKPKWVEKVLRKLLKFLGRFLKAQRLEALMARFEELLETYHGVTEELRNNPKVLLWSMLITFFQRSLLFFVTWLIMHSFFLSHVNPFTVILLQALVSLGADLLPLPGGTGANEALFLLMFEGFCGETLVLPVLLITRVVTYYGQLIFSGIGTLVASWRIQMHSKT